MVRGPGFLDEPQSGEPESPPAARKVVQPLSNTDRPMLLDAVPGEERSRIDPLWEPEVIERRRTKSSPLSWLAGGLAVLLLSWLLLSLVAFAEDQFRRSSGLGALTFVCFGVASIFMLFGLWGELRAFRALHRVDDLRRRLSRIGLSLPEMRASVLPWLHTIRRRLEDHGRIVTSIAEASSPEQIKAVLQREVASPLLLAARQAGRRAALEGGAVVAITPAPALEGVLAGIRGLLLIRQVAGIYGIRPGFLVTLALLRRIAWTAAGVSGFALLSQKLAEHTLQNVPLVKHLAGALPETSLAAVRLYRLATITAEACSPIPRGDDN